MSKLLTAVLIVSAVIISSLLTGWFRTVALSRKLMDVPNYRSSHVAPTPRGGGIAIIIVFLSILPLFAWRGIISFSALWALLGAGGMVGAIGWLDDQGDVAPPWRLLAHFIAALWALIWLGGLPRLAIFGELVDFGWLGDAFAVLYLVWLLNLYNFMDGIDGIAGIEAITVCLSVIIIYHIFPDNVNQSLLPLLLAAAVFGFLHWNFPRARIFMGDTGSGFIGIILGLLSLQAGAIASELFWAWVILLGAFVVDATVTLIQRLIKGAEIAQAHRSHAYQRIARRLGSHVIVSLAFGGVNLFWLLPIASLVVLGWIDGIVGVLLGYTPLVWVACSWEAGKPEMEK